MNLSAELFRSSSPAPLTSAGLRSMPFWSKQSRAIRVIRTVDAYALLEPVEIALVDFRNRWLPGLASDGILVGVNWSGSRATGYDLLPDQVLARLVVGAAESAPSGRTGETGE